MKLPNAHLAEAEQGKICGYLLNAAHPDNGGKAAFFAGLGFQAENWRALATALRELDEAEQGKICGYLLNAAHPDNGGKAAFFAGLGFQAENWRALATALRELAVSCPASKR